MLKRDFCVVLRYIQFELLVDKGDKPAMLVMVIITSFGQIRTVFFLLTNLIPKWKVYILILVVPEMICSRLLYSLLHPAILIETVFHPLLMTDSSLSYLTSSSLVVIKVVTKMSRYRSFESITCDSPLYTSSISMTRSCLSSLTFIHLLSLFESKVYINSRTSTTSMETTTHCYYCFHSVGRTRDIGIIGVRHHLLF